MITVLLFKFAMLVLPPCEYEDSPNCYWDASTAGVPGSGGHSFIDLMGTAYYVN